MLFKRGNKSIESDGVNAAEAGALSNAPESVSETGSFKKAGGSKRRGWKYYRIVTIVALLTVIIFSVSVFSWLSYAKKIASYAPISAPESLYIGAGHTEVDNYNFENVRYLYFYGIDSSGGGKYYDYLFCVYGKGIYHYRILLAFTTNNQFTYELYSADEYGTDPVTGTTNPNVEPANYNVSHQVHYLSENDTYDTYYYSINPSHYADPNDLDSALTPIQGDYLNRMTDPLLLANDGDSYYNDTYALDPSGVYRNVNKYARPLYWQSSASHPIEGSRDGSFVHYYILRIKTPADKTVNDRETDVICISAKSWTSGSSGG